MAPDDGGSTITSYDWRYRVTGSGGSGWVNRTNVTNLTQVFTGLDASTEYDVRFRATNNVGDSPYSQIIRATTDAVTLTAPSFTDDTGNVQSWTQNRTISAIIVPAASGNPTPTYAAVGSLPAGIVFNATPRVISGTPTAVGSGTIRIRATNSQGSDDWTVDYTVRAPSVIIRVSLEIDFDNDGTYAHTAADVTGDLVKRSLRATRGRTLQRPAQGQLRPSPMPSMEP